MILGGLALHGANTQGGDFGKSGTTWGLAIALYGVLALIVGKIITWFQRP